MVSAALRVGKQRMVHTAEGEQPAALQMIKEWLSFSLLSLSAIFFVVDPMGAIPAFLAIPLLAGPGSIATVTALMGRAGRKLFAVPVILSIALTCIASYLMLVAADRIARVLGVTGLNVMNRVIGLVIGALAVQFMFDGVRDTFPGLAG